MSEFFFLKTCPSSLTPNSQSHQCISGPPLWQDPSTSKLVSCSPCQWRFPTDYPSAQSLAAIHSCAAGLSTGPELWNCTLAALRKSWKKRNLHQSRAVKLYTGYLEEKLEEKKFTLVQSCEIVHWLHWWKAARKEIYLVQSCEIVHWLLWKKAGEKRKKFTLVHRCEIINWLLCGKAGGKHWWLHWWKAARKEIYLVQSCEIVHWLLWRKAGEKRKKFTLVHRCEIINWLLCGKAGGKQIYTQSCEIVHWLPWWKAASKEIYIIHCFDSDRLMATQIYVYIYNNIHIFQTFDLNH